MFEQLWSVFLGLLGAILGLLTGILDFVSGMISLPGALGLLVGILVFWLAWRTTQSLFGSIIWLVGTTLVVYVLAAWVIFPLLFGGSRASLASCYKEAKNDPAAIAVCDSMTKGKSGGTNPEATQQGSGGDGGGYVYNPTPVPPQAEVVRTWDPDGLTKLVRYWNLAPAKWPSKLTGQLVGPRNVPSNVKLTFDCTNCGVLVAKGDEEWQISLENMDGVMNSIYIPANGWFVGDDKGFNAKDGTTVFGTGDWESLCPDCYTDTVITPVPTPTLTPPPGTTHNEGDQVPFTNACGYVGWYWHNSSWWVIPTTGGVPDLGNLTTEAYARADCPSLPATP